MACPDDTFWSVPFGVCLVYQHLNLKTRSGWFSEKWVRGIFGILEWSTRFRQRSSQPDSNKFDPFLLESGWLDKWPCLVNPIPTKSTRFQRRKSTRFQQSQPDSDKVLWVNPIPTKVESTRFQQISQPDYSKCKQKDIALVAIFQNKMALDWYDNPIH